MFSHTVFRKIKILMMRLIGFRCHGYRIICCVTGTHGSEIRSVVFLTGLSPQSLLLSICAFLLRFGFSTHTGVKSDG
jgi:hypothetical protein